MEPEMTVAAIQMTSVFAEVDRNRARLADLVRDAARRGATLIVAPETCLCGYASDDFRTIWHAPGKPIHAAFRGRDVAEVAEPVPGPSTAILAPLARELAVDIALGLIERVGERFFNTTVLLSSSGEIAARYRKRHLWPIVDPSWATPGDHGPLVVETRYGRLGLAICYDVNMLVSDYAGLTPDVVLLPSAWVDVRDHDYFVRGELPDIARALNSTVIFANRSVSRPQAWYGSGRSSIVRADGTIAASAPNDHEEAIVIAELSRTSVPDPRDTR
jgi:predicted amidohydrolase